MILRLPCSAASRLFLILSAFLVVPVLRAQGVIHILNCEDKVASPKRGVCANELSEADFRALAPGVSWFYNWHFNSKYMPPADVKMEFIPQVWGNQADALTGLQNYLKSAVKKPRVILAINEPNLSGQAFITPQQTAELYIKVKTIADTFNIPTIGPHMALGSAENQSIKAVDPIDNKQMAYTFMTPFLKAFQFYMKSTPVAGLGLHTYGNSGELRWAVELLHHDFDKPIWVTEYAEWSAADEKAACEYMIEVTDFMERTPYVQGYAWFKERNDNLKISLLEKEPGHLSALGKIYVAMPVHAESLYYRLPGKLPAGNYVNVKDANLKLSNDKDGSLFYMKYEDPGSWIEYNVQVDTAATYKLNVRTVGKPGKMEIVAGGQVVGVAESLKGGWQTIKTSVPLGKGPQKLRVRSVGGNQAIGWIEFAKS